MPYVYLFFSILMEVVGTTLLKKTDGFSNLPFTVATLTSYGLSFYCLSFAVKSLPVSIVYATWSGVGMVLVAAVSYFIYKQALDFYAIAGLTLICAGVMMLNLLSKTASH